jgi:hypothetical protein
MKGGFLYGYGNDHCWNMSFSHRYMGDKLYSQRKKEGECMYRMPLFVSLLKVFVFAHKQKERKYERKFTS